MPGYFEKMVGQPDAVPFPPAEPFDNAPRIVRVVTDLDAESDFNLSLIFLLKSLSLFEIGVKILISEPGPESGVDFGFQVFEEKQSLQSLVDGRLNILLHRAGCVIAQACMDMGICREINDHDWGNGNEENTTEERLSRDGGTESFFQAFPFGKKWRIPSMSDVSQ